MIRQSVIFTLIICVLGTLAESQEKKKIDLGNYEDFAADLYTQLISWKIDSNVACAPISVRSLLSLVALFTTGEAYQEMYKALHLKNVDQTLQLNDIDFDNNLKTVKNATLYLANGVYISKDLNLEPYFKNSVKDVSPSGVGRLNADDPSENVEIINNWVANQTGHKVRSFLENRDVESNNQWLLLNAIYFKAKWATKFNDLHTVVRFFATQDGYIREVAMMNLRSYFNMSISKELNAKFIELPYANKDLKMVIAVPNSFDGLPRLEQQLKNFDYKKLNMAPKEVYLTLPRFKVESKFNFETDLQQLGIRKLFGRNVRFEQVTSDNIYLDVGLFQKVVISVDEEGAEPSKVEETPIKATDTAHYFSVDKPFHFVIKYLETTVIEGHVVNPIL